MAPDKTATDFVKQYCSTFDGDWAGLATFYRENSTMTFEGNEIEGSQKIVSMLTTLPFQEFQHRIFSISCHPYAPGTRGVVAYVWGEFLLTGESVDLKFSQVFELMPASRASYYALNHIFRLHYV